MKKYFSFLAALMLLIIGCASAENAPIIRDDAGLLTDGEIAALTETMAPICEYGTPMFWSTTESGDYRRKAEQFYYQTIGNSDGVLFVIDMRSRQLTVLAGGSVYKVINAGEAETITDNVYRMAGRGEYAACAQEVFREVLLLLRGEQIARPMKLVSNLLLACTLALLAMYLFIHFRYEAHPAEGKGGAVLPVTAATAAAFTASLTARNAVMTKQKKVNISSSSGGGSGGGGHSGGGGGGGFSGGGGSHGF